MNRPALLVFVNTVIFTFVLAATNTVPATLIAFTIGLSISASIWLYSYRKERREWEARETWEAIRQEKLRLSEEKWSDYE